MEWKLEILGQDSQLQTSIEIYETQKEWSIVY